MSKKHYSNETREQAKQKTLEKKNKRKGKESLKTISW